MFGDESSPWGFVLVRGDVRVTTVLEGVVEVVML